MLFSFLRDTLISGHLKDGLDPQDRTQRGRVTSITLDIDKHLLKIMQIACKAEKLEQALDAARLLGQPQSLDAAAKLASFFHQRGLSERIELIKEARSGEGSLERERKESKWGHLVDNRTLVDSVQEAAGYDSRLAPRADSNSLSKPVSLTGTSKRSLGDSSALGQMPGRTAPVMQHNDSALATSSDPPEYDMMAPMEEDIPEAADEETQVVDSLAATPVAPAPPKKAANPFAKQNKPSVPAPTSSNPFAKKSNGKASDLKRSESFFDRVEGHGTGEPSYIRCADRANPGLLGSESETKGSKDKSKQSTLFGMPPGQPAEPKKNAGRKRKAAAPEETKEIDESQKISSSSSGLSKFLHKPVAPEQSGQSDGSEVRLA